MGHVEQIRPPNSGRISCLALQHENLALFSCLNVRISSTPSDVRYNLVVQTNPPVQ